MKRFVHVDARVPVMAGFFCLLSAWGSAPGSLNAQGPVIQTFPSPGIPGPPFYANFQADFMPADDGIVAIAFYRQPSCIPVTFNLLVWFDPPAAFGCDLTVEGKRWLRDPATDPFPFQIRYWGLGAVPVYFVSEAELRDATQDGVLTIAELQALPSLVTGVAEIFEQVIHNSNQAPGAEQQGHGKGHEVLTAQGTIAGTGVPFFFHYVEEFDPNAGVHTFPTIRIDIG